MRPRKADFHIWRMGSFVIISFLYALVFFHRVNPSIVAADMAQSYNVSKGSFGIFSSMYFYPYAIIQPFAGLLADIMEPSYLIGFAHITSSIGSFMCGYSKSFFGGCVGRLLVGLGSGPTYVPVTRYFANWFDLSMFPVLSGILLAIGGCGGIVAQGLLPVLTLKYGWRLSFYLFGLIDFFFAILCLIFVKGNPVTLGFDPVNEDLAVDVTKLPLSERLSSLAGNFITVINYPYFWVATAIVVTINGPYFNAAGLWIGSYLKDVFDYDINKSGRTQIYISVGMIIGSLLLPLISNRINSRKRALIGTATLSFISAAVMYYFGKNLPIWGLNATLIVFGAASNPVTTIGYPLIREYYHPSISATSTGCSNFFTFMSSAGYQTLTGIIIQRFGTKPGTTTFVEDGYKYGLWLFSCISFFIAIILGILVKDTHIATKEYQSIDEPNNELDLTEKSEYK